MQLFSDTFFPPASFTFFTVLTCSLLFAGKNGSQLFFSFLFLVSTALTFAAGFTQTLSIPFMRWRAVQESGIMCITVSCCGSLLLTCFPLLWHGFLHMLQSLWGCPHLCVGCPRAAAPQGCCCPGTFCHNHSPLRVGGLPYLLWHRVLPAKSTPSALFQQRLFPHLLHASHVSSPFLLLPAADALSLTCLHGGTLCFSNSCSFRSWQVARSSFGAG